MFKEKFYNISLFSFGVFVRVNSHTLLNESFQVKKEMLLAPEELQQFQNHSSQMAALDFMVSVASNTFIPTYDGNMAKLVEGHRRYVNPLSTWTLYD